MPLVDLSDADRDVVRQCVAAIARGDFIDDVEFRTRLGLAREQVAQLLSTWPQVDDRADESDACLALNNCMNEICHCVPITEQVWGAWFTIPPDEVKGVYRRWALSRGWQAGGLR